MAHERTCFVCKTKYQYCAHGCRDYNPNEPWRYLFHDYKCRDIYEIWQQYRGKEITKEQAKELLSAFEGIDEIIASNSPVTSEIKEIFDIHEKPVQEEVEAETQKEIPKIKDGISEAKVDPVQKYENRNKKR